MDTVDRISELPDPLLHHILSFLPLRQVVQTIVLSKRWKQSWDSFPFFEFVVSGPSNSGKKMMLRHLEQTLLKRCTDGISVKKFTVKLYLPVDTESLTSVNQSLSYAIESNVKILNLFLLSEFYQRINLPPTIFSLRSIHVLELSGFNLVVPKSNVMLSSLRKLSLCRVYVDDIDFVIEKVLVGSPLIEQLEIVCCQGLTNLELASLGRLKSVTVIDNDALKQLKITAQSVREVDVDAPSGCEIILGDCENLKSLSLCNLSITEKWLRNIISKCSLLESLSMSKCNNLKSIEVSSSSLKTLHISNCSKLFEVNIEVPNLRIFGYEGDLISFSSNDLALPKAYLHFHSENIDTQWFVGYIELLAEFHRVSKSLTLFTFSGENVNVPMELREIVRPPLSGLSQLNLILDDVESSISQIIDGLLWISPHAESIVLEVEAGLDLYKTTIQFSYKEELICKGGSRTPHCCQSFPVSCWEHCMKEVNIEISRICGEIIEAKRRLSLQDGQFFEMIDGLFSSLDSFEDETDVLDRT